jgi:hypothetical protein
MIQKSLWKSLQVFVIVLLVLSASILPLLIYGSQYLYLLPSGITGLLIPFFFRKYIVRNTKLHSIIFYSGYILVIGIYFLKDRILQGGAEIQVPVLICLGVYISSYFWLLSDENTVIE